MKEYILAEWEDQKWGIAIVTALYVAFFAVTAIWEDWRTEQFFSNTAVTFWISTAIMGHEADSEKRDRQFVLLPVSQMRYSLARIVDIVLMKLWLLLFWFVFLLVRPGGFGMDQLWYMLSFSAIAVSIILVFMIFHDFGYFETWKYRIGMCVLGALVVALLITGGLSGRLGDLDIGHDSLTDNPTAFAIYAGIFLVLAATSVAVFNRRRSYVA